MIQEQEDARGERYKYVRFLRPDMLYLAESMPSKFVGENTNSCFCTTGPKIFPRWVGDFEGICDRKAADAYMSTVRLVTQNSSFVVGRKMRRSGPHSWLLLRLSDANVRIENVVNVAFLTCSEEEVLPRESLKQTLRGSSVCVKKGLNNDFVKVGKSNRPLYKAAAHWSALVRACGWSKSLVTLTKRKKLYTKILSKLRRGRTPPETLCKLIAK
mmetsp:Transcript_27905/g.52079  ORF Transcript_27905/g.52079 Transcript_27905/m.52079 type:complete len:214 (+) Transcript_27905:705-1346(+)